MASYSSSSSSSAAVMVASRSRRSRSSRAPERWRAVEAEERGEQRAAGALGGGTTNKVSELRPKSGR